MNLSDKYKTVVGESIGEFRDKGSKFLSYCYPVLDEAEWQEKLLAIKKLHPKSRHHCYAYRIGREGNNFRANDDGEPSGTAGRPILGQIDSFELINVFIVVVRYFGGTKLGTSGLINAYKTCAFEALSNASIIEKTVEDIYRITFDYSIMSNVMNAVKKANINVVKQEFEAIAFVDIALPQSEVENTLLHLKARIGNLHLEEVDEKTEINGLTCAYQMTR